MIKILIADDQTLIRQSLKIVLSNQKDLVVTSTAADGHQVLDSVEKDKPDVILMDIRMPEMNGVQCTKLIKDKYPEIKIIVLTTFDDDEYILSALRDGASGYLLKGISMEELISAVHKVYEGSTIINPEILPKVVALFAKMAKNDVTVQTDQENMKHLGYTEKRVVQLVGTGLSNKEIASELYLSEGTIRNCLSTILKKLDLRDRTQVAIWAVRTGIIDEEQ